MPDLLPQHQEQLTQGSGISSEIIAARGISQSENTARHMDKQISRRY
jgi:hypothetical protein